MRRTSLALLASLGLLGCGGRAPGATAGAATPTAATPAARAGAALPGLEVEPDPAAIQAIAAAARSGSRVVADLQHLTDVIGPRLTGSSAMRRANEWALERLRAYGADSAWLEEYPFGRAWERGPLSLTMIEPHRRQLIGASMAWAPGTNGPVSGEVAVITARTPAEFAALHAGKLAGKWVMLAGPVPMRNPDAPRPTPRDSAALEAARREFYAVPTDEEEIALRRRLTTLIAQEGALGLVGEGEKPYGLLRVAGSPDRFFPLPYVVVAHDTYGQLHRLVTAGQRVVLRADVHNTLTRDPVTAHNTIAELRGSEKPDEVVVLGAHLDSWDLGTGATDNAAGVVAVLEAARILKASGVRPRRTIRFALFSGEEQGLFGSDAHVRARLAEMPRTQAVLVLDNGTGRITGMSLQGWEAMRPLWEALFSPIADLGPFTVLSRNKGGSDHRPFIARGVPGFNFDQEPRGYDFTWHSQADTYDHAVPEDLRQAATVMAAVAYELANLPALLPRVPRP